VVLHVYDLSNGMAKQFSQSLIGKTIDGIWHTGIVIYETEYYFGGGILTDRPYQTPYGTPAQVIPLGETEVPKELFLEFLDGQRSRFSMDKYHLLDNNCNHFTNECSQFLLGVNIPDHISGLPQEFLNTPFGMMMQPLINSFFSRQGWGTSMGPVNPSNPNTLMPTNTLFNNVFNRPTSPIQSAFNNNNNNSTTTSTSNTTTTTTTNNITTIHPKTKSNHRHSKLLLPLLLNNKAVLFEKSDIDSVLKKLEEFVKLLPNQPQQIPFTSIQSQLLQILKSNSPDVSIPTTVCQYIEQLLTVLPEPQRFPALEILRLLLLKKQSNTYFTNQSNQTISNIIKDILSKKLSKPCELLSYRVINNCFFNDNGIKYLFRNEQTINDCVECTVEGLHSNDKILKRAVSTLAYNLSLSLKDNHFEQSMSLLTTVHHVLANSELSSDPEIDFRLLMTLGTLLYCNDDSLDILSTLEFNYTKYQSATEQKVQQLVKEIQLLL